MKFNNLFDDPVGARFQSGRRAGDFRSDAEYLFTPEMELALSAAAATQRPLLVTGPVGCGKSSLARHCAARLKWRYLERTVHSRTETASLLWEVDHLKRLQDAQLHMLDDDLLKYVRPSVLWQALDPESAQDPTRLRAVLPTPAEASMNPAVVLIDEIDKADPDLPNNLLEVLGGLRFGVADTGLHVECRAGVPLIVITSNDERDLPPAFVRRCIALTLPQPDLLAVAKLHFPNDGATAKAAKKMLIDDSNMNPSAAEFLDFIQACKELQVGPESDGWSKLAEVCVSKGRSATSRGSA